MRTSGESLRILLIEDNPGDAELVRVMLEEGDPSPPRVLHAETLQAGLLLCEDTSADVALLDLGLPDSQGLESLRELIAGCPELPVVVLTGHDDTDLALEALRQGADEYLVKGRFQGDLLARTVRYAIERKRSELAAREEKRIVETLNEVGARITSELDLENLVQAVTDAATELSGAAFGAFFYNVVAPRGDAYMLYALSGVPKEAFAKFPMPRATQLFGPTFRGEGVLRLDDVLADSRYGKASPYHGMPPGHLPVRSYLAVPVISRSSEVLGGLFFGHPEVGRFTARHERLVSGVATWAALGIDNARLFDQARHAIQAREDVLGVVSHDLRNMLSNITLAVHLLELPQLPPARQAEQVKVIDRASQSMRRLIEDLLDVARLERGELSLEMESEDAPRLVAEVVKTFEERARAKRIDLAIDAEQGLAPIRADGHRLTQVFANLIDNALKFTPAEGSVRVSATQEKGEIRFCVDDTGPGIDEEDQPRLFERFFRGRRRDQEGCGLGLAICKGLVEAHGGRIWVESREPHGTRFCFTVPLVEQLEGTRAH